MLALNPCVTSLRIDLVSHDLPKQAGLTHQWTVLSIMVIQITDREYFSENECDQKTVHGSRVYPTLLVVVDNRYGPDIRTCVAR